jgi:hypothetical protein
MTIGLRVINDSSELLIDSQFVNPTFIQKLEFNSTATYTEAASSVLNLHVGYVRRDYSTSMVMIGTGQYIVLWAIPDSMTAGQPDKDVWYLFSTSEASGNLSFDCSVFANSRGSPITYSLPTAYIFAVDANGVNALTTSGLALRMYNATGQKTFDSLLTQLVPYSISDSFSVGQAGSDLTSLYLPTPTNPIYLLPKCLIGFATQTNQTLLTRYGVSDYVFRRRGQYIDCKPLWTFQGFEDAAISVDYAYFIAGNLSNLSILCADADFYQAPSGGTGGGTNPTYVLNSTATSTNEGTSITITLTTTLVNDGTAVGYTVTGIAAADLSVGGITGVFNVYNNTATASFTFANDYLTEGTEVFRLSLDGLTQYVDVSVLDTSMTPSYSWSTPNSVNEGATGYTTFNATNANGKTVTFEPWAPSAGTSISGASDGALITTSWTVSGNAATSINVQYSAVDDSTTEGPETFRIRAVVDGVAYFSNDITVNDTSKTIGYGISAADSWNESNTYAVTITANNVNGTTLYLTTNNSLVTPASSSVLVNSDSFSTNVNYSAGIVTTDTAVVLQLRTGSAAGTIVATKSITVLNVAPTYSFGTVAALNEGTSGSVQFNYSYAANKSVTFATAAPTSGADGSGTADITLNTTSLTVGNTNSSGSTTVNYSAANDSLTESTEYFRIAATVDGTTYYSDNITINDTSVTPTYTLTAAPNTTSEGNSFTVTLSTNQSGSFGYTITGISSADIGSTSLTGTLSNGGSRIFSVSADTLTEGTETFVMTLDNGLASVSVTISDTSVAATSINQSGNTSGTVSSSFSTYFVMTVNGTQYPAQWSSSGTLPSGTSLTKSGNTTGTYYQVYTLSGTPTTAGTYNFTISATATTGDSTSKSVSVVISNPAAGTNSGSAYCGTGANQYTLYQDKNDGSGGTYQTTVATNSATCGYVAPTYSLTRSVASVNEGSSFTITFSTNQSGSFAYTISGVTSTDLNGASLTGTVSNGDVLTYTAKADSVTEGTETFSISLDNGLASTTVTINDTSVYPAAGTNSGSTYCGTGANQYTLYQDKNDGSGGTYQTTVATNSATCGYITPGYSLGNTFTSLANNSSGTFYVTSTGTTSGVTLTPSISGAGASRVSVSPTSSTISSNDTNYTYFTISSTLPTSTVTAQSVTVSVAGQSFTFTVQAFTVSAIPLVTSIWYADGSDCYSGNSVTANINFDGPITAATYIRVQVRAGVYGTGNNVFQAGASYSNASFPIGATSGYYISNANPGIQNVSAYIDARTENSAGTIQQNYVAGPLVTLWKTGTIPR